MAQGFKDEKGKFHPITPSNGMKKSSANKNVGIKMSAIKKKVQSITEIKKEIKEEVPSDTIDKFAKEVQEAQKREDRIPPEFRDTFNDLDVQEWEGTAHSKLITIKEENFEGKKVYTAVFANGDEWFEFANSKDEKDFLEENLRQQVDSGKLDSDPDFGEYALERKEREIEKFVTEKLKEKNMADDKHINDLVNDFMDDPHKQLKKMGMTVDDGVKKGLLKRDTNAFARFLEDEGMLIPLDHPKIATYTDKFNGMSFFKIKNR